jgi:aminoglycoside phosphotransferase (APT) family kinase protein
MHPDADIVKALISAGYLAAGEDPPLRPLTGGVSSDVFRMDLPSGPVCVKRAIPTLRVAADWRAPVERSHFEAEWLRLARGLVGPAVPQVLFEAPGDNLFVMSFHDPADHSVWKADLAGGVVDVAFAGEVGRLLAAIHAGARRHDDLAERFPTGEMFEALRLSPYLRRAAEVHADLAPRLLALADQTAATRMTLVHGDVSPKNILHGPHGPIFLDAECAWFGDPAFDLAFCSTHLLLKGVWKPDHQSAYLAAFAALQGGYLPGVDWESAAALEARAAPLTAALLLARVDGKSPVEYLPDPDRERVRKAARSLLQADHTTMADLAAHWTWKLQDS